jgi:RNA polymerase sigma-70 factor, ECF subfamily
MDTDLEERVLVKRAMTGCMLSYETLVFLHYKKLYGMIYRLTGEKELSEDIIQDSILKALGALSTFQQDSSFSTWLSKIALNTMRSTLRRRSRLTDILSTLLYHESQKSAPQYSNDVLEGLATLPSKEREALVLTFYEGFTHYEAAKLCGCAESTISWRILKAKEKLKRFFSAYNNG